MSTAVPGPVNPVRAIDWSSPSKAFISFLKFILINYNTNLKTLLTRIGIGLGVFSLIAVLMDVFLPFSPWWWMVARCIVLIPGAVLMFMLFYTIALFMHNVLINRSDDWKPFRARLSFKWRVNMSLIAMALILVFIYANEMNHGPLYTILSAIYSALVLSLAAFARITHTEQKLRDNGIPDPRDMANNKKTYELQQNFNPFRRK